MPLTFETLTIRRQVERAVLPAGEGIGFDGRIGAQVPPEDLSGPIVPVGDRSLEFQVLHRALMGNASVRKRRGAGRGPARGGISEQLGYDLNEYFLRHPSNFTLATHVVYTAGRSPEESRDEIMSLTAL
jgi:hypothetical protein